MAITSIKGIKKTPGACIEYCTSDKVEPDGTTYKTISTGINCEVDTANETWRKIRQHHGKDNGNLIFHLWQSFDGKVDQKVANEIGVKLAKELFSDYLCVVSTHTNTDHTHNHITFNAVSLKDGSKYNDCNETYAKIRAVSDRICREYGLPVLEETAEYKPKKYIDASGKTRFFEPTERKNQITDSTKKATINDYRNYASYQKKVAGRNEAIDQIRLDIESCIPHANSYDELLNGLKNLGYAINDKTKTGGYRAHITFKPPFFPNGIRDSSLGTEYERAALEQRLNDLNNAIRVNDIDQIPIENVPKVLQNTPYTTGASKIVLIDLQVTYASYKRNQEFYNRRNDYLVSCIQENLKSYAFLSAGGLSSLKDLQVGRDQVRQQLNQEQVKSKKCSSMLLYLQAELNNLQAVAQLQQLIDSNKGNSAFIDYELPLVRKQIHEYKNSLGLLANHGMSVVIEKIKQLSQLSEHYIRSVNDMGTVIGRYDQCIDNLQRIADETARREKIPHGEDDRKHEEYKDR